MADNKKVINDPRVKGYLIMIIVIALIWIAADIFLFTKDILVAVVTLVCFVVYLALACWWFISTSKKVKADLENK